MLHIQIDEDFFSQTVETYPSTVEAASWLPQQGGDVLVRWVDTHNGVARVVAPDKPDVALHRPGPADPGVVPQGLQAFVVVIGQIFS